jgi:hypothetical protein
MKKYLKNLKTTALVFSMALSVSYSQVTLSCSTCSDFIYGTGMTISNATGIPSSYPVDAGTTIYRHTVMSNIFLLAFRSGNYWYLGRYGTSNSSFPFQIDYKTLSPSSSNFLPCSSNWTYYSYGAPSTNSYNIQVSSGTCDNSFPFSSSTEILPNLIRLPNLPTNGIPSNPQNGMMYYDSISHSVKVFSNGVWKSLSFQQ